MNPLDIQRLREAPLYTILDQLRREARDGPMEAGEHGAALMDARRATAQRARVLSGFCKQWLDRLEHSVPGLGPMATR